MTKQEKRTMADFEVVQAMLETGGDFVKQLGRLWMAADAYNREKIREGWDEVWRSYSNFAEILKQERGERWWEK
jgi:hypothetical protein